MTFDMTFNVGNILAAAGVILTIVSLHKQNTNKIVEAAKDLAEIKVKVDSMWAKFMSKKYGNIDYDES